LGRGHFARNQSSISDRKYKTFLHMRCGNAEKETQSKNFEIKLKILPFQDSRGNLLKRRLSGVTEQEYTMLYGISHTKEQHNGKECQTNNEK